jgi:hypothetical protein
MLTLQKKEQDVMMLVIHKKLSSMPTSPLHVQDLQPGPLTKEQKWLHSLLNAKTHGDGSSSHTAFLRLMSHMMTVMNMETIADTMLILVATKRDLRLKYTTAFFHMDSQMEMILISSTSMMLPSASTTPLLSPCKVLQRSLLHKQHSSQLSKPTFMHQLRLKEQPLSWL